jgi:hypothetical protein
MWYGRVPTESWSDIVDHYRLNYDRGCGGERYRPIVRLVETIAASSYAPVLFGRWTLPCRMDHRQGQLDLSRTRLLIKQHQMLAVSYVCEEEWFLFEYYEAAQKSKPWATASAAADGFAELERVLRKRLRWFQRSG